MDRLQRMLQAAQGMGGQSAAPGQVSLHLFPFAANGDPDGESTIRDANGDLKGHA